jgi:hypothetical protein
VAQRIFGIALGYEDLNDHDELRHDPVLGLASGKLEARRIDCAVAKRIVLDLDGSKASCYGLYNFALQMVRFRGYSRLNLLKVRLSGIDVRRAKTALSSGCKPHPANSLPPEATGAVMEVTKWPKPSGSRVTTR